MDFVQLPFDIFSEDDRIDLDPNDPNLRSRAAGFVPNKGKLWLEMVYGLNDEKLDLVLEVIKSLLQRLEVSKLW